MFDEGFGGVDFSNEEREARRALADQSQSSGRVYLRILDLIRKIRRTTRSEASFETRRNALFTLRRIADLFVMRTADDPLTRGVQEQFRGDGEMGRTFIQILSSMSDFEKKRLLDSIDEDMPFGGKIFETALMAKASGIMPALEGCLEALRMPSQSRVKDSENGGECPTRRSPAVTGGYTPIISMHRKETIAFSRAFQGVLSSLNINWHAIRKSDYEQITAATNVYNKLIDLTNEVDRAARPSAPFSIRRHALVKLLKIASTILRTVDRKPAAAYPIKGRFLNDDILGPTCRMIAFQMTSDEKQEVLNMRNGKGLTFEAELVKIVKLAKRHNILLGMRSCLAQLRCQTHEI
ncbi:hypothetical protein MPH_09301 [Macrophomina phaseolina MS6]|uniref:Uncharacterized protein n=1 Tax=Macrophomina phaseolina (strain MS6) TaxID=1126212 RepID=K2RL85_MACPH|nr:hypothetical protein MPH_09301 [Macrophomina phaseolina MS6]